LTIGAITKPGHSASRHRPRRPPRGSGERAIRLICRTYAAKPSTKTSSGAGCAQPGDQGAIPPPTDRAAEPEPGRDHQRQRHPDDPALLLDADLVRLHRAEIARLADQLPMDRRTLGTRRAKPIAHRLALHLEGDLDGRRRAAMRNQRHDAGDDPFVGPSPMIKRARPFAEDCAADGAAIAQRGAHVDLEPVMNYQAAGMLAAT
jgi:hypothetical protein